MRKFVTYSVVIATIVWSFGLAAVLPAAAAYSPSHGDYVKTANDTAVYYINADGKRQLFSNLVTFRTWDSTSWGDLVDSGQLKVISQDDFDALPVADNVTARPGVNLITFDNSPKTYAVLPGAELSYIPSAAVAEALYGADWQSKVITIQSSFETNYSKTGPDLTASSNLPDGSLIKYEGSEDIYYIQNGEKRLVTDDAFIANGFMDSAVITVPTSMSYDTGVSITGEEASIANVDGVTSSSTAGDGTLSVTLASETPATTTLLENEARAVFTVVNLTNNSSDDVTVDSFKIERTGLASDDSLSTVAAYLDSVTGSQVGLNKTLNSDHMATIGDDFTVAAGTTRKLYLVANMPSDLSTYIGDQPSLTLYSMDLKGGATLSASLPITGNVMNLNSSISLATVKIGPGANNPSTDSSPKVGDKNVEIAEVKINNSSSTEEVEIQKMVFKQAGTVSDSDVEEYNLVDSADGTVLATAPQVDKYIEFDLSPAMKIGKAKTKNVMVKAAEIIDGSSRTIQLDIYRQTDVVAKTLTYNAYRLPNYYSDSALSTAVSSQPYLNNTQSQTIGNGTLKVEPSSSFAAQNIAENQNEVQLGEWLFTVKGEGVDITNLEALITITGTGNIDDITNAIFYDVDTGNALTGASDPTGGTGQTGGVTSTDTISLDVGVHKIGLKANLNADFANNDTIVASIDPDTDIDTTGQVTGNDITESPTNAQSSATLTIKTASLAVSVSPSPVAQNVIRGDTVTAANIILDASSSGDDIKVTQLKTVIHTTTMSPDELSSLKIYDGDTELSLTSDPDPTSSTAGASVTTTWSLTDTLTIPKGTVKTLTIKALTAGSTSANDIFAVGLQNGCTVTAKDSGGEDVTPTYTYSDGSNMTIKTTGSLTLIRSDENVNGYLNGSTAGVTVGTFTATATYGDVDIEKIYLTSTAYQGGGTDELAGIYLYDGATQIAEATITSSNASNPVFNMEGDPLRISANTSKELTIKVDTGIIANDGTATGASAATGFTFSITADTTNVVAKTAGNTVTPTSGTLTFASYAVVKSQPTITISASGDSLSANGTYDLLDVTVAADSKGPVGIYKMTFKVTTTTVTASGYVVSEDGATVATEDTTATEGINKSYVDGNYELLEVYFNKNAYGGELRQISAGTSKTYVLQADITGYNASTSNGVSTSMTGDDSAAVSGGSYYLGATTVDSYDDDDFIWSDLSYGNTSTTATTTAEWMNGYGLSTSGGFSQTTASAKSI